MAKLKRGLSRRISPAWVAVILLVILGLSFTLEPVRTLASSFLGLFRVQKIEFVAFDPSSLLDGQGVETAMQSLEKMMDEQVAVDVDGEPQNVDEATLRSLSAFRVRLPQAVDGEPHYALTPGATIDVKVDLPRIKALLSELGYQDVQLPSALDGADVSVQLSPSAISSYGSCEPNTEEWAAAHGPSDFSGDCTALMQMVSPDVSAPEGLDLQQLGLAYLQLLGMSPSEATQFSQHVDWTATLVIPVPQSEATYTDVSVDGVTGALIRPTHNRLPTSEYLLMWIKDDVVYALMGTGSQAEALQIANSLQ